jgi:hypothetical protein
VPFGVQGVDDLLGDTALDLQPIGIRLMGPG